MSISHKDTVQAIATRRDAENRMYYERRQYNLMAEQLKEVERRYKAAHADWESALLRENMLHAQYNEEMWKKIVSEAIPRQNALNP